MDWKNEFKDKELTHDQAAMLIKSGDTIAASPAASFPLELVNALTKRDDIKNVNMYTALITTLPDFINPQHFGKINYHCLFMGPLERAILNTGMVTPVSLHFSTMVDFFKSKKFNAVFMEVSPPDEYGYMSIGPAAPMVGTDSFRHADKVIVQINPKVPFINGGDVYIHMDEVDAWCFQDRPVFEIPDTNPNECEQKIASFIEPMIPDKATIQLGIGQLANAIGNVLVNKKDLGIHTEILTPSMIELYKRGVVTGKYKEINKGKIITSFMLGKQHDYEFLHRNPVVEMHTTKYVNNPYIISQHKNMISVNNALSIDLTGQVASESIGFSQYSATGGQLDFVRGATMSEGGKSIIALNSTAKKGSISRIKITLDPGTAVTTPRSDVHYVVTEFGTACLKGKSIPERVIAMIKIAHPNFRDELSKQALEFKLIKPSDLYSLDKAA